MAAVFKETDGDLEATVAALSAEKANVENDLAEAKTKISEATAQLAGERQEQLVRSEKRAAEAALAAANGIAANWALREPQRAEIEKCKRDLEALGPVEPDEIVRKAASELAEMESTLMKWDMMDRNRAERSKKLEADRMTMATVEAESKEHADVSELEKAVEAEEKAVAEGKALAGLYSAAVQAFRTLETPTCPLCGSPMPPGMSSQFEALLHACHTDRTALDSMKSQLSFKRARAAELSGRLSALIDAISANEKWLAENPGVDADTLDAMRKNTEEARTFIRAMSEKADAARRIQARIDALESSLKNIDASLDAKTEELVNLGYDQTVQAEDLRASINMLEAELSEILGTKSDLQAATAVSKSLEARKASIERGIAEAQAKRDNVKNREQAFQTLTKVRDWLHYSNGPHKLAMRVMDALTDDTNKFLSQMDSPFSVQLDPETLGYLFDMNDGSVTGQPADALSGGQKVVLAVAFRLASYCMFAGKYGLMALDEPTAYLDDANVGNFCVLLESVKATAAEMDLQILISTHERAVLPYMDSVLDIDAAKA